MEERAMEQTRTPTLSELLDDPIVATLMERDGTSSEDVRALLERVRRNLRARRERLAA